MKLDDDTTERAPTPPGGTRLPAGVRELALFGLALLAYQASRAVVIGDAAGAVRHAWNVIDLERAAGIFWEPAIQGWTTGHPGLVRGLNAVYLLAHLPVTAVFFVWLWRSRRDRYRVVRNGFLAANAIALAVFVAFPVAPPRLAGADGLVDTLRQASGVDLHGGPLSSLFNPYAAVPSMHFGYALLVGVGITALARRPLVRAIAPLYPALVFLTIVATGNHFVLDAVAGGLVMGAGVAGALTAARAGVRSPGWPSLGGRWPTPARRYLGSPSSTSSR
jgi:hypothetical protein